MKDTRFLKQVLFVNGAVPAALLLWDQAHHRLGADPVNFAILTTGMLALVFIALTLLVTPLRKITGWNWLIFSRRTLGLYAFFYASVHFGLFFIFDRALSLSSTLHEILHRSYLIYGIIALLLMVPLAITSTNGMIKRLGARRWKALHSLVYLVGIAAVTHYCLEGKYVARIAKAFVVVLAVLLGFRLIAWLIPLFTKHAKTDSATAKPPRWSGDMRVTRIVEETPEVRTFRLTMPGGEKLPFAHQAGQYLVLSLLIDGKKVNRTFTIASSPTRPEYCEVTIKREQGGVASRFMHEQVREGDLIHITAPAGRFTFDGSTAQRVVLIGGGVGITPLMSILRFLTDRNWKGEIHLLYSVKTPRDIIFQYELEDLRAARFPNLHCSITLTQADGTEWTGLKGRINRELLKSCMPDMGSKTPGDSGAVVFICGPQPMMEPTVQMLEELGVPKEQIRMEAFVAAKRAETARPDAVASDMDMVAGTLTFAISGKTVVLPPDKTILEVAEDAGVSIDYECRSGICGTCKTRLLGGQVTMDNDDALDASDKANHLILACQARSSDDVTIEA